MGRLQLFAIGIDEVRDMFRATPQLAERLRTIAGQCYPAATSPAKPRRGGLFGALRPRIDPPQPGEGPTSADAEALLAAQYLPPQRLPQAWQIVIAWLRELGWGELELDLTPAQSDRVDFDLARAGLPSQYAPSKLLERDLQIPLGRPTGWRTGYARNNQILAMRAALSTIILQVEDPSQEPAGELLSWLNQFPQWSQQAAEQQRPMPDSIAIWQP